ncbi:glycosyltransferase family 4 protein [Acidothermaceae bacterium B102]|nr:glycosyltransferase family 4 protein [Acidothermaceae bacterium B102]
MTVSSRLLVNTVHIVVPDSIDDPARPSGGNTYDREVCHALTARGWYVQQHATPGTWPLPDPAAMATLAGSLSDLPPDAVVLIDGLIASAAAEVLLPETPRLRLVVLVHLPLGLDDAAARTQERAVLAGARVVVATSAWTRGWLVDQYALPAVIVAEPGVRPAAIAHGSVSGGALVCVAAVTSGKGHADLLVALARNADLAWRCLCVGAADREPGLVERLRGQALAAGIGDRVDFTGARAGTQLDNAYAAADVLVLASHAETYGMVVTEALARGLPVIATAVGGVPDALGQASEGQRPGLLVEPGDAAGLAAALRSWLLDAELRRRLREAARQRRETLPSWHTTADQLASALMEAAR